MTLSAPRGMATMLEMALKVCVASSRTLGSFSGTHSVYTRLTA